MKIQSLIIRWRTQLICVPIFAVIGIINSCVELQSPEQYDYCYSYSLDVQYLNGDKESFSGAWVWPSHRWDPGEGEIVLLESKCVAIKLVCCTDKKIIACNVRSIHNPVVRVSKKKIITKNHAQK